jgi:hypothetical protein
MVGSLRRWKLDELVTRVTMHPMWWLISLVILGLASAFVLYTGHSRWFIRVGVLGLAFAVIGLPPTRLVRWGGSVSVLGLALVLVLYQLGGGSLSDWDEAIYAQATKEMLLSHDWWTLSWNGSRFFHKPPLYFWLTALAYQGLGVNELAARLWSALFGIGVIILTFILGVRWRSWAVGASAALLLLTVEHGWAHDWNFLSQARVGMLDVPMTFWIVIAIVLVWEAGQRPWLIAWIGLPTAMAVMTKAWPGLFAFTIPLGYWLLTSPRQARALPYWGIAGVCAVIVMLPWHLWQYAMHGELFLREYVGVNLIGRMSQVIEDNRQPAWFYLNMLRQGFPVWGYLWPLAYVWSVRTVWRQGDRRLWLLLVWITAPLLVFSMAQTKLGWYINMIYPAVALLLALGLSSLVPDRIALGIVAAVMAICCIRLPAGFDGAPGVPSLAASVVQQTAPGETIYVYERICEARGLVLPHDALLQPGQNVQPSLRFYLPPDRRLRCFEARDLAEGVRLPDAPVIVRRELRPHIDHRGQVVFEGGRHTLLRWQR